MKRDRFQFNATDPSVSASASTDPSTSSSVGTSSGLLARQPQSTMTSGGAVFQSILGRNEKPRKTTLFG